MNLIMIDNLVINLKYVECIDIEATKIYMNSKMEILLNEKQIEILNTHLKNYISYITKET